ncbi:H-NS histone family protein [Burkholderia contaminans]|uniref:H-NS histone family protein n=1 Tax=Burkholderia contaminans TaxID=488447 RepID=A0AAP1V5E4_9BURK|nr:hypothetical protein [Burkholderia contaminans]MBA9838177.1 hypothetical protein [Burkholderia contaminans]MBA9862343.1 hypothetical protein [Burkholderia contaminans]MBA9907468.1 hypothetical protein [Burkholderia contaminans]MBA9930563.1 hypothetical protein [Burkholderia contaminans]
MVAITPMTFHHRPSYRWSTCFWVRSLRRPDPAEPKYQDPKTGATWNGRGKPPS